MKIALIACAWPPYSGGIGNSAKQISDLIKENHEVENFYPAKLKPFLKYGHGSFAPSLFFKLKKFDYIYLHYPYFGTAEVVWFFKLFFKKPKLIIHYHMDVKNLDPVAGFLSLPSQLIRSSLLKQAETIVSASLDYVKNSQIKKYYEKHQEKFKEIPFGLNLDRFKPKDIRQVDKNKIIAKAKELINFVNEKFIKRDKIEFVFVGALDKAHYFKGVSQMLQAFDRLENGNWRLTIVGDGDLRSTYEAQALELGLIGRVNFMGKLSDDELIRTYQNSDCLILPSINNNEAFGIVLIEALACGLPVIASDLPGVRKVFENYREGLLTTPGDINDLKRKLEFMIANKNLRLIMADQARILAEKKYSLKEMQANLNKIFKL